MSILEYCDLIIDAVSLANKYGQSLVFTKTSFSLSNTAIESIDVEPNLFSTIEHPKYLWHNSGLQLSAAKILIYKFSFK